MPTELPYKEVHPGDLLTAELWNSTLSGLSQSVDQRIDQAINDISAVPSSGDADKLGGKTPQDLKQDIIDSVIQQIHKERGYRQLFRKIPANEPIVVEHNLNDSPLVDVYHLDRFRVICSEDGIKEVEYVLFYFYHGSEKRLRTRIDTEDGGSRIEEADIEPSGIHPFRIPFATMLSRYDVPYEPSTTLDDLLMEFWKRFNSQREGSFDDVDECRSPWFDRCCGDRRTVKELQNRGDWNDIYFKFQPRKTINYLTTPWLGVSPDADVTEEQQKKLPRPVPYHVDVAHHDLNTLGLYYARPNATDILQIDGNEVGEPEATMPVMLLLKV